VDCFSIVDSLLTGCSGFGREEDTGFCGCHDGQARLGLPPFHLVQHEVEHCRSDEHGKILGHGNRMVCTKHTSRSGACGASVDLVQNGHTQCYHRPAPVKNIPSQFRLHSVLSHLTHRPEAGCLCSTNAMCRACRLRQSAVEFRGKYISHCSTGWI
jgi:hypothetical protein